MSILEVIIELRNDLFRMVGSPINNGEEIVKYGFSRESGSSNE